MLARYRLIENWKGVDVFPNDPAVPRFQFGVCDVTEFGNIKMKWRLLSWYCSEDDVLRTVDAFSRPSFTPESVLGKYLRDLELIHHPKDMANEARDLANELRSRQPEENEPAWSYFLCNASEVAIPLEDRTWTPLQQPNDIKMMKRLSRERSRYAIMIRVSLPLPPCDRVYPSADQVRAFSQPWLLQHYKLCTRIYNLQARQDEYCQELETEAALEAQIRSEEPRSSVTEG